MRRALALLSPALTRRVAGATAALQPVFAQGFAARFSADAAPSAAAAAARGFWYDDRGLSVQALHDEIFRRWEKAPTPSKGALDALLSRVSTPEDAKIAAAAVERFHKQRCAAGWLTGLGPRTSALFAAACARVRAQEVAVAAFSRGAAAGLSLTPDTARRLLASAAQQGADATLAAYRSLRCGGLRVTPDVARLVMRGLQGPGGGGSPRRALDAGAAFVKEGVPPGRRAWNALLCATAAAPDLSVLEEGVATLKAAGETPNAITHLALAQGALLRADADAVARSLAVATELAPQLLRSGPEAGSTDVWATLARIMAVWAAALPQGTATPGGTAGLAARTRDALAAAGGRIPLDVDAAFEKAQLVDGPVAAPAAA